MSRLFSLVIGIVLVFTTIFYDVNVKQISGSELPTLTVEIDGVEIDFSKYGAEPFIENGSTYVPLRSVFEELGFEVRWDDEFQLVLADLISDYYLTSVRLFAGNQIQVGYTEYTKAETYLINHTNNRKTEDMATHFTNTTTLEPPYQNIDGRIVVPVRAIAEGTGAKVEWDNDTRTVMIDNTNPIIIDLKTGVAYDVINAEQRVNDYFYNNTTEEVAINTNTNNDTIVDENQEEVTEMTEEEKRLEVVRLVNEIRVENGLNELEIAEDLMYVAQWHTDEMVELDYFSHMSPTLNLEHTELANHFGGNYRYAGENTFVGFGEPNEILDAWLNSTPHTNHIFNDKHKYIGVGITKNFTNGSIKCSLFMGY